MRETIEVGYQAFVSDGDEACGALRDISPDGLVVYVFNWALTPGKGHGMEANLAYIAMAAACLLAGGGALALDPVLLR